MLLKRRSLFFSKTRQQDRLTSKFVICTMQVLKTSYALMIDTRESELLALKLFNHRHRINDFKRKFKRIQSVFLACFFLFSLLS